MYTCMEYTLYDTIYSDERTLQMHVHPPPPQKKKKKKKNKKPNKQKPLQSPTAKLHLTSAEIRVHQSHKNFILHKNITQCYR